ncbi:MAG: quinolinate synthase NadA [Acidobacteriota bacterium]
MEIEEIRRLSKEEIFRRIEKIKDELGKDLVILAHYYQNDDIVRWADFQGDSLKLAQYAASQEDANYIVFCSVNFMAEMARLLAKPYQKVLHPEFKAKCPLAEMADVKKVKKAWSELNEIIRDDVIPITYVNSTVELKAFCGENDGLVCTSANAPNVFKWELAKNKKIFFFPDENLGTNTSLKLGFRREEILTWEPNKIYGGNSEKQIKDSRIFLWKGFCYVHLVFTPFHVEEVKEKYKDIKVIVHPECFPEVCALSDSVGSTSFIKKTVEQAPPGSSWAIGTEWNLVNRLKNENIDKFIIPLAESRCSQMAKINLENFLFTLESILTGRLVGEVIISEEIKNWAEISLRRMLEIKI